MSRTVPQSHPELPDGWECAYYSETRVEDIYLHVVAVYEHIETGLKCIIQPRDKNENPSYTGHTTHRQVTVYPVYSDIGILHVFRKPRAKLHHVIGSVAPECSPREGTVSDMNAGPYKTSGMNDTPVRSLSGPRAAEGEFDWESELPKDALNSLQTLRQYPLDYTAIVDAETTLHTIETIALREPELIPDPYPLELEVAKSEEGGERYVKSQVAMGTKTFDYISKIIELEAVDSLGLDVGAHIGTVYLEFQRENFPYNPNIVDFELTEGAKPLLTPRGRLKKWVSKIS